MDLDEVIIEEVRNNPLLYDLNHVDYQNLKKKECAWGRVADCAKISERECKKRWKNLRDCYKRSKRAEIGASGSSAQTTKRKWRLYGSMQFLDKVTYSRQTVNKKSKSATKVISEVSEITDVDYAGTSLDSIEPCDSRLSLREQKKHKKDSKKFEKILELAASNIRDTCGAFIAHSQALDSTAIHFKSLAAKISEAGLPPSAVNEIEAQVSQVVFSGIRKYFEEN